MPICRACGSGDVTPFLDLGKMPLAGSFLSNDLPSIQNEKLFSLVIDGCGKNVGLFKFLNPVDPNILFQDYSFSSSTIGPLVSHFENYAQWINTRYKPKSVVEFGCNDGAFFKAFDKMGILSVGVDISANITEMARKEGRKVKTGFFNAPMARTIQKRNWLR